MLNKCKELLKNDPCLAIVIAAAGAFSIFFSVVSHLRYEAFSFTDFDSAIFIHENWKILHGSTTISILDGGSLLGNTVDVITFLTAPLFGLFGSNPEFVFFLQAFALGFSAVPIFLIARRVIDQNIAAALAVSFLFNPSIWYISWYEYNALNLVTFTLLWAFYFFQTSRFRWFVVFLALSTINRLDVGLVTGMFGVYAFYQRRSWMWVLTPIVVSAGWILFGVLFLIPHFRNMFGYYEVYYPQFGSGFFAIIANIALHPQIVWTSLATSENAQYFLKILLPVAFLPVAGLEEFLICTLSMLQHLLSARATEHTIEYHYTSPITPFVYISAAYGLARISKHLKLKVLWGSILIAIALISNFQFGPLSKPHKYIPQLSKSSVDAYKEQMLARIPSDADAASTFEFSSRLASRFNLYSFHYFYSGLYHTGDPYPWPKNVDAALINFEDLRLKYFAKPDSDLNARRFFEHYDLGVVDMANSIVLFKKGFKGNLKLYDVKPALDDATVFEAGGRIGLKNSKISISHDDQNQWINFVYHWIPVGTNQDNIWQHTVIMDAQGKEVVSDVRPLCYNIYPVKRWRLGEEVTEYYRFLLPGLLQPGAYRILVAFYLESEERLPIRSEHQSSSSIEILKFNIK